MTDLCRTCGALVTLALSWHRLKDGRYAVRAGCPRCGNWLRWQAQTSEALAIVGEPPKVEPPAQTQQTLF